jgi:hypothetical protein
MCVVDFLRYTSDGRLRRSKARVGPRKAGIGVRVVRGVSAVRMCVRACTWQWATNVVRSAGGCAVYPCGHMG